MDQKLLNLIRNFLIEIEAERAKHALALDADLELDLGLGSIEKAQLLRRVEKEFNVTLDDQLLASINTPHDILTALYSAHPAAKTLPHEFTPSLEETGVDPSQAKTLLEVLWEYAQREPERPHIYLQDDQGNEQEIRYGRLFEMATAVAEGLIARGIKQGETVAIMLPTSEDFFYAFFGILLAGGIPVPIYPPFRLDKIEEYAKREALILQNAEVRILITFEKAEGLSKLLTSFISSLKEVIILPALIQTRKPINSLTIQADDPALIQYTSGSTGNPKGVLLSHNNLLNNIRAYGKAINLKPTDVAVSWLPLYHDMGLIGTWLGCLYYGIPVTIMSPLAFLNHPERWLWTIHYHRATLSAGPNFAYELCLRKIDDDALEGLDLRSWRLAFNGAEAIFPKTLEGFSKRFSRYGFRAETFFPVYGLAESSVALTFPPVGRKPKIDRIQREQFEKHGSAISADINDKTALEFVFCGRPLPDHEIRVVDDQDQILAERKVGNLQFRGPSSMQGYYHNPAATAEVYHNGWWSTGDLGYMADGELVVTGRKKDIIIKSGRNIFPAEIEDLAGEITGVRKGCVVAFGVGDPHAGTEKLIIVAETNQLKSAKREQIIKEITDRIILSIGLPPDQVILAKPHTIPKTSSGKLRRAACRKDYLENKLSRSGKPTWLQVSKLFVESNLKKAKNLLFKLSKLIYTTYVDALIIGTGVTAVLISYALPKHLIDKLVHYSARFILLLSGCRIKVTGKANLPDHQAMIYVCNHASYVDTLVLLAILPAGTLFVAKKELLTTPIIGHFIKKSQHPVVDRTDISQSINDIDVIQSKLMQGSSILIFPEGTFTYATGLRPFKLGAFKIAVEANYPICPIGLQGTRKMLRSGSNLFRPGKIKVHIDKPIYPTDQGWHEVIRLRSEARLVIAKNCGEPVLDLVRAGLDTVV